MGIEVKYIRGQRLDQSLATDHATRCLKQVLQQAQLTTGKRCAVAARGGQSPRMLVQLPLPWRWRRPAPMQLCLLQAPAQAVEVGGEQRHVHWRGQASIGPLHQPPYAICTAGVIDQHHHTDIRVLPAQLADDAEGISIGQVGTEQHDIRVEVLRRLFQCSQRSTCFDGESVFEQARQQHASAGEAFFLQHQDAQWTIVWFGHARYCVGGGR